ncbi:Ubiquitin carboxyl-terminal hydrolase 19 [Madurella fahalii]|uniref:Ubiquitin carboxyl-terminal hydrolase 19 n=1 Tax=Madurella fahalii TaxID=1157608 RepID=A0ABQ0GS12_9PEZI
MEPVFIVTREELHDVQMELKRIQHVQQLHGDRLRSLEKRQADDAALKSVWNSPFPSVLGGTPQHGPVHMPSTELFSDLDEEQGQNLLGTLQLETEDEPIRRGAASRANSVRFDESALHGANFGGHGGRHSNEFGPIRPGSGMGGHQMMERSYSHKSDGRHSSAGHSVHSMHSGVSGRTSSLGLDNHFLIGGREDDSSVDIPEPPPVFYVLGSPPSIIRCWLTANFTSDGLLYAVVCTGSQKSTVEYSLLRELDLVNNIHRDVDSVHRITLPVFLAEARVTQSNSRSTSPAPQLPSITASFEVTGMDQQETPDGKRAIRVFIGSHTLRMHSADILLSQNLMTLYGSDRDKLSIPFVRPEDDAVFKHLTTANMVPSRTKLNAAAPEFVSSDKSGKNSVQDGRESGLAESKAGDSSSEGVFSPTTQPGQPVKAAATSTASESGAESEKRPAEPSSAEVSGKQTASAADTSRREPSAAIRTPWRQTAAGHGESSTPLSGYQPAARPRSMKVLRPNKSSNSSTRTGAAYEPASAPRSSGEQRRKADGGPPSSGSWGSSKRSLSGSALGALGEGRQQLAATTTTNSQGTGTVPRTANNPLGSASAFSWIASSKPKAPTTAAD